MFFSEDGWHIEADKTLENELRLAQAKRIETERFSGQLTAKLSDVASAVSAIVGLGAISKRMQANAVTEKDFEGYVMKEPVPFEGNRIPVYDFQAPIDRSRDDALYEAIKTAKFVEFARLDAIEEWEASKQPQAAPVVEVAASEPRPAATVTHTTKTPRKDSIDPVIALAQTKCRDPKHTNQVWPQMQVLADSEQAPFIASTEKGLKYHKKGGDAYFTRDALDKRLHPEKRKPAAARR